MNTPNSTPSSQSSELQSDKLREVLTDAIQYWEPRRIVYNLVLTAVVVIWVVSTWPHFRDALTWPSAAALFILAALANVCYCAAYLVDVPIQYASFLAPWRRRRWGLWLAGTLLAIAMANYWIADEIYWYVR